MRIITTMLLFLLISLALTLFLTLPLTASPLVLGVWILFISSILSTLIALTISSWTSIITILIYIGGLNVLFAYFIATIPNQYLFSKPLFISRGVIFAAFYTNFKLTPPTLITSYQRTLLITKLFFNFDALIFLLLALILFLALIAVVKIARRHHGPLRPFTLNYVPTSTKIPPSLKNHL